MSIRSIRTFCLMLMLGAILSVAAGCQSPHAPDRIDELVLGEVMMRSELAANLRDLSMPGGRLSGSENGYLAEQMMADRATVYGLQNVRLEPFEMTTWQDEYTVVTLLDDPPVVLEGAISLGGVLSTPEEGITAELVNVGQGTPEEFEAKADALPGRFALTFEGGPHRGALVRRRSQAATVRQKCRGAGFHQVRQSRRRLLREASGQWPGRDQCGRRLTPTWTRRSMPKRPIRS